MVYTSLLPTFSISYGNGGRGGFVAARDRNRLWNIAPVSER